MECTISMKDEHIEKVFGKKISDNDFSDFCRDAIASKMFLQQFVKAEKGGFNAVD